MNHKNKKLFFISKTFIVDNKINDCIKV